MRRRERSHGIGSRGLGRSRERYRCPVDPGGSPWTSIQADENGTPVFADLTRFRTTFRLYGDLPQDEFVYFLVRWRFIVGGIQQPWEEGFVYYTEEKAWITYSRAIDPPPGAEQVQVAIVVRDFLLNYGFSTIECHSQGSA